MQDLKQTGCPITPEKWTEEQKAECCGKSLKYNVLSEGRLLAKIYPVKGSRQWEICIRKHSARLCGAGISANSKESFEHMQCYEDSWQRNSIKYLLNEYRTVRVRGGNAWEINSPLYFKQSWKNYATVIFHHHHQNT